MKTFKQLKAYQRGYRDGWAQGINLRVHRALSWLQKAEKERENNDLDGEFIALWISFKRRLCERLRQRNSQRRTRYFPAVY